MANTEVLQSSTHGIESSEVAIPQIQSFEFGDTVDQTEASILALSALVCAYENGGVLLRNSYDVDSCHKMAGQIVDYNTRINARVRPIRHQHLDGASPTTIALLAILDSHGAPLNHSTLFQFETGGVTRIPHKDTSTFPNEGPIEDRLTNAGFSFVTNLLHEGEANQHPDLELSNLELRENQAEIPIVATGRYKAGDSWLLRQLLPNRRASIHSASSWTVDTETEFGAKRKIRVADHLANSPDHLVELEEILIRASAA